MYLDATGTIGHHGEPGLRDNGPGRVIDATVAINIGIAMEFDPGIRKQAAA
ncbi:MAG: hypothetical protein MESAZ_00421 [Saezia sanguinis]